VVQLRAARHFGMRRAQAPISHPQRREVGAPDACYAASLVVRAAAWRLIVSSLARTTLTSGAA
jgi:hypothetical protein